MTLEQALEKIKFLEDTQSVFINYFLVIIGVILVFGILVFVLMLIESKNKDKKLKSNEEYLKYIIEAQEQERNRLSRELHDTIAQDMRYVSILVNKIDDKALKTEILDRQTDCIKKTRNMCSNLALPEINSTKFEVSLQTLVQKFIEETEVECRLTILEGVDFNFLDEEKKINLYRIVQELLQNISKHAEATEVTVFFRNFDGGHFKLIITDDGKGISPEMLLKMNDVNSATIVKNHFGVRNVKERVSFIGGKILWSSEEGFGAEVEVIV
ncbi:MAG: hypothetical protein KBT11_11325 [Treponema sp.]|nr:hypothetical protein [Candidatus Treponema equifaecale]